MRELPLEPIRHAMNSGEFDRAQLLWNECAAGLADELGKGRLSEVMLAEVRQLVEWSRIVVLCERTHLQDQLNKLQAELRIAAEYGLPASAPAPRIVAASF